MIDGDLADDGGDDRCIDRRDWRKLPGLIVGAQALQNRELSVSTELPERRLRRAPNAGEGQRTHSDHDQPGSPPSTHDSPVQVTEIP